jgi:hypothetical protein
MTDLASRVESVLTGFAEAHGRLVGRLEGATDLEAATTPPGGGWTPAQIGAHVAGFDLLIAGIVSGDVPYSRPAAADFVERPWSEIQSTLTGPLHAPASLQPPPTATRADALAALNASGTRVAAAFRGLDPSRAALTFTHASVGTLSLVQVGEWIVAHTIRHNAQMKRALGR